MAEILDALALAEGHRLSVIGGESGCAAVPMVRGPDGWRRARPGDGTAEALLRLLARQSDPTTSGRFAVRSWATGAPVGERAMAVDQTNESVVVGETAVVKWATHLQDGPHPAPGRISLLRNSGFRGMPRPLGMLTWSPPDGAETVVAYVDEYVPGAVDGWTWAVDLVTAAALDRRPEPAIAAATAVGALIADMHAALAATASVATGDDADRWRRSALATLETACTLHDWAARSRDRIAAELDGLGTLAGTPVIDGHGDLHVGQVLRAGDRFVVTDFDGNPVLPASERVLSVPAALDVAGMVQSLAHTAIVARAHTELDVDSLAEADTHVRGAFLRSYRHRLTDLGHHRLFDPQPLRALRLQQVLREIVYAARHLPRWMYVPDAALPALLDERVTP